jgi:hypothetical protein
MSAIVIRRTLDSDTLHLPELGPLIGKEVEIVVRERPPLPPGVPERWRPLWEVGGEDLIDPEAVRRLREGSRTDTDPGVCG